MGDGERFSVVPWDGRGIAAIEARGSDRRAVLEAGLAAVLALIHDDAKTETGDLSRAIPIHGEGADLAALFADLLDDLFLQIEEHGAGLRDVTIDGVLQREGGFVAWGYGSLAEGHWPAAVPLRLHGMPTVVMSEHAGLTLRASLVRV